MKKKTNKQNISAFCYRISGYQILIKTALNNSLSRSEDAAKLVHVWMRSIQARSQGYAYGRPISGFFRLVLLYAFVRILKEANLLFVDGTSIVGDDLFFSMQRK